MNTNWNHIKLTILLIKTPQKKDETASSRMIFSPSLTVVLRCITSTDSLQTHALWNVLKLEQMLLQQQARIHKGLF